jgi:glutaredoxin 3
MVVELDERADGDAIQQELARMTGQRSVPNVFVQQQHIGGNDDTQAAARTGTLQELLDSSSSS